MVQGQASVLISLPQQRLFDFIVADFIRNYRRWSPEVKRLELLSPGPLRIGSRARQVRIDQGRRSDTTFRVATLEPPSRVGFVESANKFRSDYTIEAVGTDTRLTFIFELTRLEFHMRPFEKLIRFAVQDGAERVVRNIKMLAENESTDHNRNLT